MSGPLTTDLEFRGSEPAFESISARAAGLGVELEVVKRDGSRGDPSFIIALVAAGTAEAVRQLLAEFADSLRERKKESKRKRGR